MSYTSGNPTALSTGITGTCANGHFTIANELHAYLVPGGALVKDLTTPSVNNIGGGAGILAFPAASLGSLSALNGNYAGLVADPTSSTYTAIQTSLSTSSSSATLTLSTVAADLTTTTGSLATLHLTAVDTPSAGFIEGTVTVSNSTANVICMANVSVLGTSKNTIFCLGQKPSDTTKPYNIILVSH